MQAVTYSKNVFIPLTNACRNRCGYCGFRAARSTGSTRSAISTRSAVSARQDIHIMRKDQVRTLLKAGREHGCKEALFTFGERPESEPLIKDRLESWGYQSIIEYLYDLCEEAIDIGLLPHSNPGVIGEDELKLLKDVNASMGLMLESSSSRLCEKGMPHEFSPGKAPEKRIGVIEAAGRFKIPFTTGILIGIGETRDEITASLLAIKELDDRYHHIQEVIIQNFKPKPNTPMENHKEPSIELMVDVIKTARAMMPDMDIQVPPNLNPDPEKWKTLLKSGATDLGGVSPVTIDYVNPLMQWPRIESMEKAVRDMGLTLKERLCIYPKFIKRGWYSNRIDELIERYVDEEGLVR